MNTSMRSGLAALTFITGATLATLAPAQAQTTALRPVSGAWAGTYFGPTSGGEGHATASSAVFEPRWGADGSASATLANGQLHSRSVVPQLRCVTPACDTRSGMISVARYWDTITFHNGEFAGRADLSLSIDGVLAGSFAQATVRWFVSASPPPVDFFNKLQTYAPAQVLGSGTTVIDDGLALPLGDTTMFVFAELHTQAMGTTFSNSVADFGNTLHFNWTLPAGVTTSSASGVFMTAVPEPGGVALMLAGLGAICVLMRQRAQ